MYGIAIGAIARAGRPDLVRAQSTAVPRVRVVDRHRREPRPELGDMPALLCRRPPLDVGDRTLDRRVLVRRHRELALDLGAGEDVADRRQHLVRVDPRGILVHELDAGLRGQQRSVLGFGPAHQDHVGVSARHRVRGTRERRLLQHPDVRHDAARFGRAEALRDDAARDRGSPRSHAA